MTVFVGRVLFRIHRACCSESAERLDVGARARRGAGRGEKPGSPQLGYGVSGRRAARTVGLRDRHTHGMGPIRWLVLALAAALTGICAGSEV